MDDFGEHSRTVNDEPDEQADIHAAIRRGLADVEAGRFEPADKVMRELRAKHGIPT